MGFKQPRNDPWIYIMNSVNVNDSVNVINYVNEIYLTGKRSERVQKFNAVAEKFLLTWVTWVTLLTWLSFIILLVLRLTT